MINLPHGSVLLGNATTVSTYAALRHAVDELKTDDGQELEARHVQKSLPGDSVRPDLRDPRSAGRGVAFAQKGDRYETIAARLAKARSETVPEQPGKVQSIPLWANLPVDVAARSEWRRVRSARQVSARYRMTIRADALASLEKRSAEEGEWRV